MGRLALTRKKDETILIGDKVSVKVVEIRGGSVKLLVEAPNETKILRKELADGNAKTQKEDRGEEDEPGHVHSGAEGHS